ncbi:MAG: TolC family protein [Dysgonamonadaceae bacterium]|jgi:outer membrane protein TolC|nr:TolC family protein [Dysgonamonadaceae bacterium]
MKKIFFRVFLGFLVFCFPSFSQTREMTLNGTIEMATSSSLQAFQAKNLYLQSYWTFRSYRAARLPSVDLTLTPLTYNRTITQRYDSEQNLDIYRPQQQLSSYGELSITQNFDLTGGQFYINSGLNYIRNMGDYALEQFNTTPIRIGYYQKLFGFNSFRWERRIEPLKYEKAKKQFIFDREQIAETSTQYFFNLAIAQIQYEMAQKNLASTDTLYRIGKEKHKIASITQTDLLALRLDSINARNTLKNAEISLKRAMNEYASFLNLEETDIKLAVPDRPKNILISAAEAMSQMREHNPDYLSNRQSVMESERDLDQSKKSAVFDATVNASVGFNQVATTIGKAYAEPLRQDLVSIAVSIPILDWGVRKGQVNVARSRLNTLKLTVQQAEQKLEQDIMVTVDNFNIQQDIIRSQEEAFEVANRVYEETRERFISGLSDLTSLTLALERKENAQISYITALRDYWLSYYKIRKLTLYDFENKVSLSELFDSELDSELSKSGGK